MKNNQGNIWDDRYDAEEFVYGISPNEFFKEQLDALESGNILLPAEGEGRNAVYASKKGWNVTAFDSSKIGKEKALKLAENQGVDIEYQVIDALGFKTDKKFDVLGLVYAHFPVKIRKQTHQRLLEFLKPNGKVIFEAFAKEQLGNPSGGPKNIDMLFSIEEIKDEFKGLKIDVLEQQTIQLNEGNGHIGKGEVIRFVGVKP